MTYLDLAFFVAGFHLAHGVLAITASFDRNLNFSIIGKKNNQTYNRGQNIPTTLLSSIPGMKWKPCCAIIKLLNMCVL